jgi:hypothetical protein
MPKRGLDYADRRLRVLIAAYFEKPVEKLSEADISGFARKFFGFCNGELNVAKEFKVRDFLEFMTPDHVIYGPTQGRFLAFFKKRWPFFDEQILYHDIEGFGDNFYREQAKHTRTLVIRLGAPLRAFDEFDRAFLVGVYELYRYSFANEGKINIDVLVIKPDPANPTMLQMEVIVGAIRSDKKYERYEGLFCQYGHSLLGLPVYVDFAEDQDKYARVRRYEFSDKGLVRTVPNLIKLGIVSGNSVQLGFPVAAKCLISKLSNDPARADAYTKLAKRYDASKLYEPYVLAISNDIREAASKKDIEQDDSLLVAWSSRPPKARRRNSFPELADEPNDPMKTAWPNR